ncbi:TPA: hypothetical protein EYO12_00195 [Candidatus Saccharibacteria bacterium]|nr:hypothetical protein [Candidatus Saccharibacteria bacterium]HIO87217.1 hypothetical protein [Candidatus Saccharibacteria bacterium]
MKILITGAAASGKTTLCRKLNQAGYKAFDDSTDIKGIGALYDQQGKEVSAKVFNKPGFNWNDYRWDWNLQKLEQYLHSSNLVFICGFSQQIDSRAKQYFDKVILLDAPSSVRNERLDTRELKGYGYKTDERKVVFNDSSRLLVLAQTNGWEIIDSSQSVTAIKNQIIDYAN